MVELQSLYTIRFHGRLIGPLTLEKVREMYKRGHISKDATLALNGQAFRRLDAYPEIFFSERSPPATFLAGSSASPLATPPPPSVSLDGIDAAELLAPLEGGNSALLCVRFDGPAPSSASQPMPLYAGNLHDVPFSRLLLSLSRKQLSGRLTLFDREQRPKEIAFREGQPLMPAGGLSSHDLRLRLLQRGLPLEAIDSASKASLQTDRPLADCLLSTHVLPPHLLFEILQDQFSAWLLQAFSTFEGRYLFFEEEIHPQAYLPVRLDLIRLIKDGIYRTYDLQRLQWLFEPFYSRAVTRSHSPPIDIATLALPTQEERIYRMIGRTDTLWSLLHQAQTATRIGPLGVYCFLFFLAQVEVLLFDGYILGSSLQKDIHLLEGRA